MSLANDKNLIKQLLSLAQTASVDPPQSTTMTPEALAVTQKLIENLKKVNQAGPGFSGFTAESGDVSITDPKVLRNLNNLITFLAEKHIKTDDLLLVTPAESDGTLPLQFRKYNVYYPYPKGQDKPLYFIHKDGLISFIRMMQDQANQSGNKFMKTLLENLISDVNNNFVKMETYEAENKKTEQNTTPPQQQSQQQLTTKQLQDLSGSWPLFPNKIDVDQITKFIIFYINYTGDTTFNYIQKTIQEAKGNYRLQTQLLGTENVQQIKNRLLHINPNNTAIHPYIELLSTMITAAASALGNLETRWQSSSSQANQALLQEIKNQQSYYRQNIAALEQLTQEDEDDFRNIQQQNKRR